MRFLRRVCLGVSLICSAYVHPAAGDAAPYDLSNFPGCVSIRQKAIEGDIPRSQLIYKSFPRKQTDDKKLHTSFLSSALEKIKPNDENISHEKFYVTFIVYYRYNKKLYKQFATAVICKEEFGKKENQCRNRNYYFFSHIDPVTLANIIVDDISKSTPIIRSCIWNNKL